jgi:hypothetical protein
MASGPILELVPECRMHGGLTSLEKRRKLRWPVTSTERNNHPGQRLFIHIKRKSSHWLGFRWAEHALLLIYVMHTHAHARTHTHTHTDSGHPISPCSMSLLLPRLCQLLFLYCEKIPQSKAKQRRESFFGLGSRELRLHRVRQTWQQAVGMAEGAASWELKLQTWSRENKLEAGRGFCLYLKAQS